MEPDHPHDKGLNQTICLGGVASVTLACHRESPAQVSHGLRLESMHAGTNENSPPRPAGKVDIPDPFLPTDESVTLEEVAERISASSSALLVPDRVRLRVVALRNVDRVPVSFASRVWIGVDADERGSWSFDAGKLTMVQVEAPSSSLGEIEALMAFLESWPALVGDAPPAPWLSRQRIQVRRRGRDGDRFALPHWHFHVYEQSARTLDAQPPLGPFSNSRVGFVVETAGAAASKWLDYQPADPYSAARSGVEAIFYDGRAYIGSVRVGRKTLKMSVVSRVDLQFSCHVSFRPEHGIVTNLSEPVVGGSVEIDIPLDASLYDAYLIGHDDFAYDRANGVARELRDSPRKGNRTALAGFAGVAGVHRPVRPRIENSVTPFVDESRIDQLRALSPASHDLSRLIALCEELNVCWEHECYIAVGVLTRAAMDHVTPIFGATNFAGVLSNYAGSRSFKDAMAHLDRSARKIADAALHQQIRAREVLPSRTQVDFSQSFDLLLSETISLLK